MIDSEINLFFGCRNPCHIFYRFLPPSSLLHPSPLSAEASSLAPHPFSAEEEMESFQRETSIMQDMKHPNIVQLLDVFEDEEHYYVVMEQVGGGELFDQIIEKGCYPEDEAAVLVHQVWSFVPLVSSLSCWPLPSTSFLSLLSPCLLCSPLAFFHTNPRQGFQRSRLSTQKGIRPQRHQARKS